MEEITTRLTHYTETARKYQQMIYNANMQSMFLNIQQKTCRT